MNPVSEGHFHVESSLSKFLSISRYLTLNMERLFDIRYRNERVNPKRFPQITAFVECSRSPREFFFSS